MHLQTIHRLTPPRRWLVIAAALCVSAGHADACVSEEPSCQTASTGKYSVRQRIDDINNSAVLMFSEYDPTTAQSDLFLVECSSREAIKVKEPAPNDLGFVPDTYWNAYELMETSMLSSRPVSLDNLRAKVERLGVEVVLLRLPDGHCGCELLTMPEELACGDDQ